MKGKTRRFVVLFDTPLYLKRSRGRKKQLATVTARGPIDAYRKVTGYSGLLSASHGYSNQLPARRLFPYDNNFVGGVLRGEVGVPIELPSAAFILPLGKW